MWKHELFSRNEEEVGSCLRNANILLVLLTQLHNEAKAVPRSLIMADQEFQLIMFRISALCRHLREMKNDALI